MQYTENYSLKLPGYGDNADVGDLNDNTTAIDALIHANRQIEAPAFSTDTAYTTGDMCVYENVLYKFTADKAAGNWDSTKVTATNLADEVTDAAQSGGTEVIANPSAPATEDLNKLQVENTVYGIPDPTVTKEVQSATGTQYVEFSDGADAPLVKCTTAIQGNQDLHGYDKPWVGGAGKNKFQTTATTTTNHGKTFTIESDGSVSITGVADADRAYVLLGSMTLDAGTYILSSGLESNNYFIDYTFSASGNKRVVTNDVSVTTTQSETVSVWLNAEPASTPNNVKVYPMIRTSGDSTWEPYSNICPITAYNESTILVEDENEVVQQTSTATFSNSIYQGNADFVGSKATATWGYIASYNGETLPGEWISSMDEYAPGTTPTTGAQVAYELATPTTSPVTPTNLPLKSLFGYNHIESSTGEMEVEYITHTYQPIVDLIDEAATMEVYSTDEQEIGVWIDGSKLYKKTFTFTISQSGETVTVADVSYIDQLVEMSGVLGNATMVPQVSRGSATAQTWANISNGNLIVLVGTSGDEKMGASHITLKYTKTSSNNRSLSKGATDSLKADLSEVKDEGEESVDKVDKVDEPTETIEEKEENAGESNSENER